MTRTLEIQLLPGETEVNVTVKAAATVAVPKPVQPFDEAKKVAALRALNVSHFLHGYCGNEFSKAKSLATRLQRNTGSPAKAFETDSCAGRRVMCDYFVGRRPKGEWPADVIAAIQKNLDLLGGHADVLRSYELAAEVTRLKGVFVQGYTAKK